ncbi:Hypothetical protein PHPALM_13425 [Phytophthora palmivora]|uniref:Uncharacterized protein n=1 Tax=Phytophthora palmivora TaxID=4796 RepID=A0A2P4XXA0_9STRA|nr:Hypothetical protein PHPALM_13425 [Phytophthora palmivora]
MRRLTACTLWSVNSHNTAVSATGWRGSPPPSADDLEQAEHHVDEVADQASQGVERLGNQQADGMAALERSNLELRDLVARMQGQIDLLARLQRRGAQQ